MALFPSSNPNAKDLHTVNVIEYERTAYMYFGIVIVAIAMSNLAHDNNHTDEDFG